MKVNAINGINQSVSFEKRSKRTDKAQAQHQTNPMKAVPLAVLIAMSPLNAPAQNTSAQTSSATKTEQVAQPEEKVVLTYSYEKPTRANTGKADFIFYSTDGDDSSIEKVKINFETSHFYKTKGDNAENVNYRIIQSMYTDTIEIINETVKFKDGREIDGKYYYLSGKGNLYKTQEITDSGVIVAKPAREQEDKITIGINEEFYKFLAELFNGSLVEKETFRTFERDE